MCMEYGPLLKAINAYIEGAENDLSDELDEAGYAEPDVTLKYARQIEGEVTDALVEETDYFVKQAEEAVNLETFASDIWPKVKLTDGLKAKLAAIFTERLGEFMPEFIGYYIAQTDRELKLEQISKRTLSWVDDWSQELSELMQLSSHNEIETILSKGLEAGDGVEQFTRAIRESGIRDEYYRARRVSITEVLTAHSVAQQEAYMQSPATESKCWRHTGAYRNQPRENHVDMDGQIVPKGSPYNLHGADGGIYYPMYPRDPSLPPGERINCHCLSQPVVNADVLGLSLEERQKLQREAIDAMDDAWEKELDAKNRAKAGIEEG